jgi:hypothetical protein
VLAALCCLIALLAVQQELESRTRSPGAVDYLFATDAALLADPLGIASQDLELVGVSVDGKVVGYATQHDATQTMRVIDEAMCARGWALLETDAQSVASYVWHREPTKSSETSAQEASVSAVSGQAGQNRIPSASVLFICSARDGGSSVVAELL